MIGTPAVGRSSPWLFTNGSPMPTCRNEFRQSTTRLADRDGPTRSWPAIVARIGRPLRRTPPAIQRAPYTMSAAIKYVGVDHCRGYVTVPKQLLDRADVVAGVVRSSARDSRFSRPLRLSLPAQGLTVRGQKPHAACALRTKRPESVTQIAELTKEGVSWVTRSESPGRLDLSA